MNLTEQTTDWWKGGIIYQIYPRSFQDTTGSGTGDLATLTWLHLHIVDDGANRDATQLKRVTRLNVCIITRHNRVTDG